MMLKKMSESNSDTETLEAYRVFDKEMDGFITRSELRMIFSALPERLTEEEIEEMLEAADVDGKPRGHLIPLSHPPFLCVIFQGSQGYKKNLTKKKNP